MQPTKPPQKIAKRAIIPRKALSLRRRFGIPISNRQASDAPPARHLEMLLVLEFAVALYEYAVVVTVRVAVPADVPVMLTGLVEPKLSVGRY